MNKNKAAISILIIFSLTIGTVYAKKPIRDETLLDRVADLEDSVSQLISAVFGEEGPEDDLLTRIEILETSNTLAPPDYDTGWVDINTWYPSYSDPTRGYFGYVDDSFVLESENFYVELMERYEVESGVYVYHDREDVDWVYAEGQDTDNPDPPPTDHSLMIYSHLRASNDPPKLTHQARLMLWYLPP
jgi:hypothetical protein